MKLIRKEVKGLKKMRIKLTLPYETILDEEVDKITAPGAEGSFQILPKHIDVVATLQPGILILTKDDKHKYFAIHKGVLVKENNVVYVSSFQAIEGDSLDGLHNALTENFKSLNDREKKAQKVLVKLETDTIRRFMEIEL